jgi:hypothetical protein
VASAEIPGQRRLTAKFNRLQKPATSWVFWGPMAIAIMGGLVSATLLTLCFVPALYAAWSRVGRSAVRQSQTRPLPASEPARAVLF